ncbi:MAG TPA: N-acetylglucosamine-6-phosphate deacetylase [Anaerolineales bacterium]|jgi:N-acetylglucosamine-6-phosphate deacetylase|nr:N-acetylglucosamine-6-phosphate deacetylase [Anaerolineales bacterium]
MMQRLLIHNARLFTPSQPGRVGWLFAEDGRIHSIGFGDVPQFSADDSIQKIDAEGKSLLPGFIDLHVHGAMGHEAMDASASGLEEMARFYASHGVTSFLATTWTASREAIRKALDLVEEMQGPIQGGATLLGVHLEGPYLNPARCGAQDVRQIRRADREEALAFLESGVIRLLALAPEYDENLWLIEECVKRGITVSAAHTAASYEQMQRAAAHGLTQATHTFNAMQGLGHREPGTVGAALTIPQISCELIADNIHVHPAVQKILLDVKSPSGVILITDAIRAAGLPAGEYMLDDRAVNIQDGAVRLPDGTLAGSILTMERALQNLCAATGRPLEELWVTSSQNAARAIGISSHKGSLEAGKDADLVLLDDSFQVHLTVAQGEIIYDDSTPDPLRR